MGRDRFKTGLSFEETMKTIANYQHKDKIDYNSLQLNKDKPIIRVENAGTKKMKIINLEVDTESKEKDSPKK